MYIHCFISFMKSDNTLLLKFVTMHLLVIIHFRSTDLGITLQPVNDNAPVINTNDSVVFTENQPLRPLQDTNITDADEFCMTDSLYSSRIQLFNYSSTETLNVSIKINTCCFYYLHYSLPTIIVNGVKHSLL